MCGSEKHRIPVVEHYLKKFVKMGYRILDIGCGMGQYRTSTPAFYVGLDITDEPYPENRPRIVDIVATGTHVPAPDRCYDLVFSVGALYQMQDPPKVLAESYRVLRPGGRILLFDYNRRTQKRLEKGEGQKRPCWTQWGLKLRLRKAGFRECELLLPVCYEVKGFAKVLGLLQQERLGQWVIATGIKKE